jgi:hypothetical protein
LNTVRFADKFERIRETSHKKKGLNKQLVWKTEYFYADFIASGHVPYGQRGTVPIGNLCIVAKKILDTPLVVIKFISHVRLVMKLRIYGSLPLRPLTSP